MMDILKEYFNDCIEIEGISLIVKKDRDIHNIEFPDIKIPKNSYDEINIWKN